MARPIRRLLIANRGEIAVRIARTCAELGVESVAVFSAADRGAMHVRAADRAVAIGGAAPAKSYLRGERLIAAAKDHDCDAVHPGYGFLSQNGDFADAVRAAGLVFVGPGGDAMRVMGDKTAARRAMAAAGVPVIPGHPQDGGVGESDAAALRRAAPGVGFPLLVKAAAGGGGRGMRIVHDAGGLDAALDGARREAEKAFGDGRLFLERYLTDARHVEIQVLADEHGGCVHLLERECSVQRRYQKLIEESPSPGVDAALREAMGRAAVTAAAACGYANAGTVEFLVTPNREFFFLEMNTRLQVEHPVTELLTGLDLVAEQLRVAAGEPLRFAQADVAGRGHAIECRINAEDPAAGFAPASGTLLRVVFPRGPGLRVDAGYESGDDVPVHYDSLLAKLVVHAADRDAAVARMRRALGCTAVLGVATNVEFLAAVLDHATFRRGAVTTGFVESELFDYAPAPREADAAALIALALGERFAARDDGAGDHGDDDVEHDGSAPWRRGDGYRPGGGA